VDRTLDDETAGLVAVLSQQLVTEQPV
jgi:hypothetical protein